MSSPLVDVIIPVHNCELFIGEAIDSILQQTFQNLRIIVVNDGSTDTTLQVLDYKKREDSRIIIISPGKIGLSSALNIGLENSDAQFIAFLDADDLWKPTKLEKQLNYLQSNKDETACFTMIQEFESFKNPLDAQKFRARKEAMKGITRQTFLGKKELVNKLGYFNSDIVMGEFLEWLSPVIIEGKEFFTLPEALTMRRIHDNNLTRGVKASAYFEVIKAHLKAQRNNL